jgi:hypothetical protein
MARLSRQCHAFAASVMAEYGLAEAQSMVRNRFAPRIAAQSFICLALMLLVACVPTVQRAGSPMDTLHRPALRAGAERFISFDGAELGLTAWLPPNNQEPRAVIIGLHGMNDYANTFLSDGPVVRRARRCALRVRRAWFRPFAQSRRMGWRALMSEDLRTAVASRGARTRTQDRRRRRLHGISRSDRHFRRPRVRRR